MANRKAEFLRSYGNILTDLQMMLISGFSYTGKFDYKFKRYSIRDSDNRPLVKISFSNEHYSGTVEFRIEK